MRSARDQRRNANINDYAALLAKSPTAENSGDSAEAGQTIDGIFYLWSLHWLRRWRPSGDRAACLLTQRLQT
jgi:hypothetical protein